MSFSQNIDRRPPTLLRNSTLLQSPPGVLESYPTHLYVLPHADPSKLTLITNFPLESHEVSPVPFFDGRPEGIKLISRVGGTKLRESASSASSFSPISRFVRTPEGQCIGIVREEGIELQLVSERGTQLVLKEMSVATDILVVLDKGLWFRPSWDTCFDLTRNHKTGRSFATYNKISSLLTLHSDPPSALKIPTVCSLFATMMNGQTYILGITPDCSIVQILANIPDTPQTSLQPPTLPSPPVTQASLELVSVMKLPPGDHEPPNLKFIIPVDPMGWTDLYHTRTTTPNQAQVDALLSVNEDGDLAFWAPEDQPSPSNSRPDSRSKAREVNPIPKQSRSFWQCTGTVRTGRKGLRVAACSSTKKSVLGTHGY